jgi:23S rRNA (guanosine2251-2'-O)-methyltransferase
LANPARARFQESRGRDRSKPEKRSGHETPSPRHEPHQEQGRLRVNLFGMHAVREAILNPARDIRAIYIAGLLEENIQPILDQAEAKGLQRPEPEIIEKIRLDRVLPKGTVHQGIACDASPLDEVFLPDLVNRAAAKERSVLVMLDQVTDPHNMGAILRSACAFGADGVIVQSRHAPELSGVVAKTASGAIEHVPVVYETNLSRAIESLKDAGYFVIALDERGEKTLSEAPLYDRTLLVLGAEGPGLRPLVRNHCDLLLRLPTQGGFTSLNVSNAAAVAMYAMVSRRKG